MAPCEMLASLPFDPEAFLVLAAPFVRRYPEIVAGGPIASGFNPTLPGNGPSGWVSSGYFGLDQGIIVLMIENYRSRLIWSLMRRCPYLSMACAAPDFPAVGCRRQNEEGPPEFTAVDDRYTRARIDNLHPPLWRNPDPAKIYDLVVLGGGPGGVYAAKEARRSGRPSRLSSAADRRRSAQCRLRAVEGHHPHLAAYADMRAADNFGARRPEAVKVDLPYALERMGAFNRASVASKTPNA